MIALVTHLLETANAAPATTRQRLSPNERYQQSEQPNAHAVEATDLMQLFWKTTTYQVRRGGITLEKEGQRHYFPLPTDALQESLYKQTVIVRYDDDYQRIYLFEATTEAPICSIDRPKPVHGAKANQHGEDMGGLAKHGHLLRGIEQRKRQSNERVRDELTDKYGEMPFELLDKLSTPKADYHSAETAYRIGQVLSEHDVDEDLLVPVAPLDPLKGTVFSQTARKAAQAPRTSPLRTEGDLSFIDANPTYEDD